MLIVQVLLIKSDMIWTLNEYVTYTNKKLSFSYGGMLDVTSFFPSLLFLYVNLVTEAFLGLGFQNCWNLQAATVE